VLIVAPKFGCDHYSHIAWLWTIKEKIEYKNIKNIEVTFLVISDLKMNVSRAFGMLQPAASSIQAVRAVFIIDPKASSRSNMAKEVHMRQM
jgi:peroxiredoxin (alkyl hydroperoxide reductase subunit C)